MKLFYISKNNNLQIIKIAYNNDAVYSLLI